MKGSQLLYNLQKNVLNYSQNLHLMQIQMKKTKKETKKIFWILNSH